MRWLGWIDDYFHEKSRFEKFALFILLGLLIGYFLHIFFVDDARKVHYRARGELTAIEHRIAESQSYIDSISNDGDVEHSLQKMDEQITQEKNNKGNFDKKLTIIDQNLKELSGLLFNKENWSEFINSITSKARQNDITIETLSNKYVDNNGSFGHVLEIGVKCRGSFDKIIGFMNDMEQNTLVTDIYRSDIRLADDGSGSLLSDINISVWGVNH